MNRIIVALDNMSKEDVHAFLQEHGEHISIIKIGLELYLKHGRNFICEISERYPEIEIFLDLKLHDIPSTVAKAIRSLSGLKIKFLTIHLGGGVEMIKQSLQSRNQHLPECKILGVSVLTSLDENDCKSIWATNSKESFLRLYNLGLDAKIDGIVSSAHELDYADTNNVINVCPGIRFEGDSANDQKRIMTPKDAFSKGADFLVIGRSITSNPSILKEIDQFL